MSARRSPICVALLASLCVLGTNALAIDGTGPYYAMPSWSQQLPASTRFVVLSNWGGSAVLDRETGLVWERAPNMVDLSDQPQAHKKCLSKTTGGRKGWRLPTIQELSSLVDPTMTNPALPVGHPFAGLVGSVLGAAFWSATTTQFTATAEAWGVIFTTGNVASDPVLAARYLTWCVRTGSGGDQQGH